MPALRKEHGEGGGDIVLRTHWWLTEGLKAPWSHAALLMSLRVPTGNEKEDTGFGLTFLRTQLNASFEPHGWTRSLCAPRLHLSAAREWGGDSDDERDMGFQEYVAGAIWNLDPWRRDEPDLTHDLAWWTDIAVTDFDSAFDSGKHRVERATEARVGLAYAHISGFVATDTSCEMAEADGCQLAGKVATKPRRSYTVGGELHWRLDRKGVHSSLSGQVNVVVVF